MTLPPPEICRRILALHELLGFPDGKDERRVEVLKLLEQHGLTWNSLAEFFAAMNASTATPLPVLGSKNFEKRCQKICQLHAAMGSSDKDGTVAHQKLIDQLAKQQFSWSADLAAILAADWTFKNPTNLGASTSQASTDMPDGFNVLDLVLALFEDYLVLTPTQRTVIALWVLHVWFYNAFEYTPIRSRSFPIPMTKGVPKKRFDDGLLDCIATFSAAYELLQGWKAATSLDPNPEMPAALLRDPRTADLCRPLIAVADTFGATQGETARAALIELCAGFRNQGPANRALNACKGVCDTLGDVDRIEGKALARGVIEVDDYFGDWRGVNDRGQPHELTSSELSRLLKRFGVRSRPLFPIPRKPDSKSFRGYMCSWIQTAWRVHCAENDTPTHSSKIIALAKS